MPLWGILSVLFGAWVLFALLYFVQKNKHPFKRALGSMCIGLGVLIGINLVSEWTHVYIPVSLLSVLTSAIGGVPGVTLILFLNLFF